MLAQILGLDISNLPWGWVITFAITLLGGIGVGIAFLVSRAYVGQTIKILQDTIKSHEENLKAKDELALSLAETQKQAINSVEIKLTAMTGERDKYRQELHDTREPMQTMVLKIKEYELRPDLNQVLKKEEAWHSRREEFYTAIAQNQNVIITTQRDVLKIIQEIRNDVRTELKQSNDICAEVGKALQDIVGKLDDRELAAATRDKQVAKVLSEILKELKRRSPLIQKTKK